MQYLEAQDLSVVFPKETLFEHVSFKIYEGDRIGLIGDNGSGKSTLLKILDGTGEPSSGRVIPTHGLVISRLDQNLQSENPGMKVGDHPGLDAMRAEMTELESRMAQTDGAALDEILSRYARLQERWDAAGGYDYRARLAQILAALGLPETIIDRDYDPLSGGEKMRVNLARCLLSQADLLLLDEPTNHLDFMGLEWLQNFLSQFKGALIIVSHDRYFLDQTTNQTFAFEAGKFKRYRGNYSQAKRIRDVELLSLERQEKTLSEDVVTQEAVVQTLFSQRKMTAYHQRQRLVEDMKDRLQELRDHIPPERKMRFSFVPPDPEATREDRVLIETSHLSMAFPEKTLFEDFNLLLRATDKRALIGPNGCGKTTLLRILLGEEASTAGQFRVFGNVKIAYMGQYVTFPDEYATIYDYLESSHPQRSETELRSRLHQFGFPYDNQSKLISVLSGGERHRLYLASLFEAAPDVLFMDEPTNHLDIYSRERLEDLLQEWPGALVLVSHDRFFIEALCDGVLGFIGTEIRDFESYGAWIRAFKDAQLAAEEAAKLGSGAHASASGQASEDAGDHAPSGSASPEIPRDDAAGSPSAGEEASPLMALYERSSPAHRRRLRAQWLKESQDLEAEIHALEEANEAFETSQEAQSPEAYEAYAQSFATLEHHYERYFELQQALEDSKK